MFLFYRNTVSCSNSNSNVRTVKRVDSMRHGLTVVIQTAVETLEAVHTASRREDMQLRSRIPTSCGSFASADARHLLRLVSNRIPTNQSFVPAIGTCLKSMSEEKKTTMTADSLWEERVGVEPANKGTFVVRQPPAVPYKAYNSETLRRADRLDGSREEARRFLREWDLGSTVSTQRSCAGHACLPLHLRPQARVMLGLSASGLVRPLMPCWPRPHQQVFFSLTVRFLLTWQ